jgi:hypothetical protein
MRNEDDLANPLTQSVQMEGSAAYLRRGHTHGSSLSSDDLNQRWVAAFRAWLLKKTLARQQAMDDSRRSYGCAILRLQ